MTFDQADHRRADPSPEAWDSLVGECIRGNGLQTARTQDRRNGAHGRLFR